MKPTIARTPDHLMPLAPFAIVRMGTPVDGIARGGAGSGACQH